MYLLLLPTCVCDLLSHFCTNFIFAEAKNKFPTYDPRPLPLLVLCPPLPVLWLPQREGEVHDQPQLVEDVGEDASEAVELGAAVLNHGLVGNVGQGGHPEIYGSFPFK